MAVLPLLLACSAAVGGGRQSQTNLIARGIVELDASRALLLVTERACDLPTCQNETGELLFTADGGATWARLPARVPHGEIMLAGTCGEKTFLVGALYCEGPAYDPFLLVAADGGDLQPLHRIHPGPTELERAAVSERGIVVWSRHLDAAREWAGETYRHTSLDGGVTWSEERAGDQPSPAACELPRIATSAAHWRVVDADDGGFSVERRAPAGPWQVVMRSPWTPCGDGAGEKRES